MSNRKVSNSKTIVDDDNVARYMECLCACSYIEQNMHHVHGTVRYNSIVDLETFPRHDWIRPQEHKLYNHSSQPRVQKKCVGTDSKPVMSVRHLSSLLLVAGTCFLTSCQIFPMTCQAGSGTHNILSQTCFTGYYVWISCVLHEERLSLSLLTYIHTL